MILQGEGLEEMIRRLQSLYDLVKALDKRLYDTEVDLAIKHMNVFPFLIHDRRLHPFINFPRDVYANFFFNLESYARNYLVSGQISALAELHDRIADNIDSLEDTVNSGRSKSIYLGLLQDLLDELRIGCDKVIATSEDLRARVNSLLTTDIVIFGISPENYELLISYVKESISAHKEFGGRFTAILSYSYWKIEFSEPDSIRLYNRSISSYKAFLNSDSNGFWHTHHLHRTQSEMTTDKKTQIAFSLRDFEYFEHIQIPLIVSTLNEKGKPTVQIMVQSGVYCLDRIR